MVWGVAVGTVPPMPLLNQNAHAYFANVQLKRGIAAGNAAI